ncbi:hypothetical protein PR202_ga16024 [Eleusine coracana subsp. coracana]|uniref:Uncharacterized protein n=1 Tax=Eleusine coracana subsp. coracana TaxID=191504 RepID=A0AAV5CL46_ELECO|nr:hypothetical protein QOZ80_6AG0533410 [Eleusine coracana subsp. coracana]GJM98970.1 hypothetical protein PR202_ga16024 [Eleusine coracana subsp. coracana]
MAPEWMGSEGTWFLALNAVVVAIAFLSRVRPSLSSSPRRGGGITRSASSAVLQRLRSFSIFSYPSYLSFPQPDAAATFQDTQQEPVVTSPIKNKLRPSPRALVVLPSPPAPATAAEDEDEEDGDPNAMSMEEAYALVVASRQRPEHEREAEARRSEVDAKAKELMEGFREKEELRQRRLNSIFNYTQMLKQRAIGRGRK